MRHGVLRGGLYMFARVFRCSGLFEGGNDPVPDEFSFARIADDYKRRWEHRRAGRRRERHDGPSP